MRQTRWTRVHREHAAECEAALPLRANIAVQILARRRFSALCLARGRPSEVRPPDKSTGMPRFRGIVRGGDYIYHVAFARRAHEGDSRCAGEGEALYSCANSVARVLNTRVSNKRDARLPICIALAYRTAFFLRNRNGHADAIPFIAASSGTRVSRTPTSTPCTTASASYTAASAYIAYHESSYAPRSPSRPRELNAEPCVARDALDDDACTARAPSC